MIARLPPISTESYFYAESRFGITTKEAECLRLVAFGLGNKEIAEYQGVCIGTVEKTINQIYTRVKKFNIDCKARLTTLAHACLLIEIQTNYPERRKLE